MKLRLTFVSLVAVSCSSGKEPPQQIPVTSQNSLGVVELEVEHSAGPDGKVFELVAYTANHADVASVRLHVGTIDDLPDLLPMPTKNTFGSEIVVTSGTASDRLVSRETGLFDLGLDIDPGLTTFLEIGEVATTLQSEANIVVRGNEDAYCTVAVAACPASTLLVPGSGSQNVIADQCCKTTPAPATSCAAAREVFKRSTDNLIVSRSHSRTGQSCIGSASNLDGPCDPTNGCYFGPDGWSHPTVVAGSSYNVYALYGGMVNQCVYSTTHPPTFGNVTGTQTRGRGCNPVPPTGNELGAYDY